MRACRSSDRVSVFGRVLLSAATVSVLLSGCANAPGNHVPSDNTSSVGTAEIVNGYDCLAPNLGGWWAPPPDTTSPPSPQRLDAPDAGRIPADFTPTMAVRCDQMGSIEDGEGRWSGVTAVTLSGDMTQLVAAMSEPDDRTGLGPCTADMELVPPLWLVDADGRAIHAHYPRNRCGKTKPGVHNALAGLSVQQTTTLKQTLVVPRAALDSGCEPTRSLPAKEETQQLSPPSVPPAGSPSGVTGASPAPPAPLTDSELTDIDEIRWCRYVVHAAPTEVAEPEQTSSFAEPITLRSGRFVAGGTLDRKTSDTFIDAAVFAPESPSCDESATTFLTLSPSRDGHDLGTITIELDGCEWLYRTGNETRTLPAHVHELLAMQTSK